MNAERLLARYEQIADAPDAISRLRRFILDLAVRGKLVPQDLSDEPASELLKRIAAEKARLVKAREIRTPKQIPALLEAPFSIPSNWLWSQLADVGFLSPRNEAPDAFEASFVPMPLISSEYGVANRHAIRPWGEIKKGYTHFAEGDVGLAKITPCFENGKSAVFRRLSGGIGAGTTELHIVRPLFVDPDYILLFLKCPHFIETGIPRMTGTAGQKRVPTDYFANSPFPLPPLGEQRRIVAKVDELMALCDRLEAARAEREATRDRLAASSLARLNAPDSGTFQADARFVLNALPILTTRPDQIKKIRQTVLNLAVRGKLVPQDQSDEPAEELLKRIAKEKARLDRRERTKRESRNVPGTTEPTELPKGWTTAPLSDLVTILNGRAYKQHELLGRGTPVLRVGNLFTSDKWYYSDLQLDDDKYCSKGDLIFAWSASFGPFIWQGERVIYHYHIWKLPLHSEADLHKYYLYNFLLHKTREIKEAGHGMSMIHMTKEKMELLQVPLPPLEEQRRIVAKVDELMALCDQLEASLTDTAAARRRLLDALLADALVASEPIAA